MKNWRTTVGTILTAIGLIPEAITQLGLTNSPNWLKTTGLICAFVTFIYTGLNTKDHNVSGK